MQKVPRGAAKVFKIENRKGYACVCLDNLTEGETQEQALERMVKALKRAGKELNV
jgi:hypothetical protein